MVTAKFKELIKEVSSSWAADRIIEYNDTKLVLLCENGSYLIFRFVEPSGIPELDLVIGNKWMIQFTTDLKLDTYKNISLEIMGNREIKNTMIQEDIDELNTMLLVAKYLE